MRQLGKQSDRSARAKRGLRIAAHAFGRLVIDDHGLTMPSAVGLKLQLLAHPLMYPLSAKPWSRSSTSARMTSAGAEYSLARVSTISSTVIWLPQSFSTATAVSSGVSTRSGANKIQR